MGSFLNFLTCNLKRQLLGGRQEVDVLPREPMQAEHEAAFNAFCFRETWLDHRQSSLRVQLLPVLCH